MVPTRAVTTIFITVLICACSQEQSEKVSRTDDFDLEQELYKLTYNEEKLPTEISGLQMVLIKNGEVVFRHAEGMARRADDANVILTNDHKVRIASISKFVLTSAFMTLVEAGKVDLDADISEYLGFELRNPNFPDSVITTRQLVSHTSSIRDGTYYFMGLSEDFKDFFIPDGTGERSTEHYDNGNHFADNENQGPGDYFTYSNLNFGVLSGIIENVSGLRMDQFVKQTIFDPLGLNSSFSVCTLYENNYENIATLYRKGDGGVFWNPDGSWIEQVDGDPIRCYYESNSFPRGEIPDLSPLQQYELGRNPTLFSPQGGLRASSNDLAIIMKMLLNGGKHEDTQVISQSSIDAMLETVWLYDDDIKNGHTGGESALGDPSSAGMMTRYGLSTHIVDLKDWNLSDESRMFYGHLGSAYGLQGQFWFDPKTKDGIIAFITGLGDDPSKAEASIPLYAIEEAVLRLGLEGLKNY